MNNIPLLGFFFNANARARALKYLTPGERAALHAFWGAVIGALIANLYQVPTIIGTHQYNLFLTLAFTVGLAGIEGLRKYYTAHGDTLIGELLQNLETELQLKEQQMVPAPAPEKPAS